MLLLESNPNREQALGPNERAFKLNDTNEIVAVPAHLSDSEVENFFVEQRRLQDEGSANAEILRNNPDVASALQRVRPDYYKQNFETPLKAISARDMQEPNWVLDGIEERARAFDTSFRGFFGQRSPGYSGEIDQELSKKYPMASIAGSLTAQLPIIMATFGLGDALGMAKVASDIGIGTRMLLPQAVPQAAGAFAQKAVTALAHTVMGGGLFGGVTKGAEVAFRPTDDKFADYAEVGKSILDSAVGFAPYSVGALIPSRTIGTSVIVGITYALGKAQNLPEEDNLLNSIALGALHAITTGAEPKEVIRALREGETAYVQSKNSSVSPSVAADLVDTKLSERAANIVAASGVDTKGQLPIDVVASSPELTRQLAEEVVSEQLDLQKFRDEAVQKRIQDEMYNPSEVKKFTDPNSGELFDFLYSFMPTERFIKLSPAERLELANSPVKNIIEYAQFKKGKRWLRVSEETKKAIADYEAKKPSVVAAGPAVPATPQEVARAEAGVTTMKDGEPVPLAIGPETAKKERRWTYNDLAHGKRGNQFRVTAPTREEAVQRMKDMGFADDEISLSQSRITNGKGELISEEWNASPDLNKADQILERLNPKVEEPAPVATEPIPSDHPLNFDTVEKYLQAKGATPEQVPQLTADYEKAHKPVEFGGGDVISTRATPSIIGTKSVAGDIGKDMAYPLLGNKAAVIGRLTKATKDFLRQGVKTVYDLFGGAKGYRIGLFSNMPSKNYRLNELAPERYYYDSNVLDPVKAERIIKSVEDQSRRMVDTISSVTGISAEGKTSNGFANAVAEWVEAENSQARYDLIQRAAQDLIDSVANEAKADNFASPESSGKYYWLENSGVRSVKYNKKTGEYTTSQTVISRPKGVYTVSLSESRISRAREIIMAESSRDRGMPVTNADAWTEMDKIAKDAAEGKIVPEETLVFIDPQYLGDPTYSVGQSDAVWSMHKENLEKHLLPLVKSGVKIIYTNNAEPELIRWFKDNNLPFNIHEKIGNRNEIFSAINYKGKPPEIPSSVRVGAGESSSETRPERAGEPVANVPDTESDQVTNPFATAPAEPAVAPKEPRPVVQKVVAEPQPKVTEGLTGKTVAAGEKLGGFADTQTEKLSAVGLQSAITPLPTYGERSHAEFDALARKQIQDRGYGFAYDVLEARRPEVGGVRQQDLLRVLMEEAMQTGNGEMLNALMQTKTAGPIATELGQRVEAMKTNDNVFQFANEILKERMNAAERRIGKDAVLKETKKNMELMKNAIQEVAKGADWKKFIKALEC